MATRNELSGSVARRPSSADLYTGRQVRKARKQRGLTQEGLASQLGLTFQQIQKYEAGHSRLTAGRLREIAIVLRKSIDFFYEPIDLKAEENTDAELRAKVKDLQHKARKLISNMADPDDLKAAVHLLNAMKPGPDRDAQV
ncbi:MAG: helix-turn-helix domain-containing protein [Alphaproteobacteria bacterium]|nr:helix-turn-helix domain-containing protein [Alphaproteobacteria bacterium]|tara:strand:+ start:10277 stop:10699 length:423 start_codon:yes stop_codon:yes gene_type:complete